MALLPVKLAVLTVKTLAKPLAAAFEARVMQIPFYRAFFIRIAQKLHRMDVMITRGAEGRTGKVFIASMSDDEATKLASKVFSEGFLYVVASSLLMYELRVSALDTAKKNEKAEARERALDERLTRMEEGLRQLQDQWRIRLELEERERVEAAAKKSRSGWFGFAASGAS